MKVMPGVLGQVGQSVADNLFEIGQSAVKGTVGAVADIAHESIEQISSSPSSVVPTTDKEQNKGVERNRVWREMKEAEKRRFEQVKDELSRYIQRKRVLDQKIAEEKMMEKQQETEKVEQKKMEQESWVKRIINRSQTTTEKGRIAE